MPTVLVVDDAATPLFQNTQEEIRLVVNVPTTLTAALRQDGLEAVVVVVPSRSEAIVKEAMARGAQGYLQKPFTPERIQEVIGPFLE